MTTRVHPGAARSHLPVVFVIVAAVCAVYASVCHHAYLNFDDNVYVTANPAVRDGLSFAAVRWAFAGAHEAYWIPLTWLSFMLDCQLFGVHAGPALLENVLLHCVNAVLLYAVLVATTGRVWRSALVAALFALHPLRVESVAWVSQRKDVLSTLLWMLAMLAYVRYTRCPSIGRYLLVAGCLILGLLAKPMLVTLPVVLLLLDFWPLRRWPRAAPRREGARLILEKVPLLLLAAGASTVTILTQESFGAVPALGAVPLGLRVNNALVAYVRYIGKLFWPAKLAIFYPLRPVSTTAALAAAAFLLAVTAAAFRLHRRHPQLIVGWLWYLITLLPVIGFLQVGGQSMADRYTYVPCIGLLVVVVWAVADALPARRAARAAAAAAALAALLTLAVLTRLQLRYWQNSETVFAYALAVTKDNFMAHNNLGVALAARGETDEAAAHYAEAVRINPTWPEGLNNLGNAYAGRGDYARASRYYERALEVRPGFAIAENNLATALAREGNFRDAVTHYSRAVKLKPDYFEARYALADALERVGRLDEAVQNYEWCVPAQPRAPVLRIRLARVLARLGRTSSAIAQYREALRIRPGDDGVRQELTALQGQ